MSHIRWLKEGDHSTWYFHAKASQRRRRNAIHRLRDHIDLWNEKAEDSAHITSDYFQSLFISARSRNLYPIKGTVERRVTEDMYNKLLQDCKGLQMHPNTSPGPDKMSPFLFQRYWPIIGNSIWFFFF